VCLLLGFFGYLGIAGSILPGKLVPGANLADGTRLHYRCNGLLSLLLLVGLLVIGAWMDVVSLTAISDRGLELLSTTFIFSVIVTLLLYVAGCKSNDRSASLKPHITGNIIDDCCWHRGGATTAVATTTTLAADKKPGASGRVFAITGGHAANTSAAGTEEEQAKNFQ
nr:delta(14)-sterol reductase [Tanacetum cinerariifolium]